MEQVDLYLIALSLSLPLSLSLSPSLQYVRIYIYFKPSRLADLLAGWLAGWLVPDCRFIQTRASSTVLRQAAAKSIQMTALFSCYKYSSIYVYSIQHNTSEELGGLIPSSFLGSSGSIMNEKVSLKFISISVPSVRIYVYYIPTTLWGRNLHSPNVVALLQFKQVTKNYVRTEHKNMSKCTYRTVVYSQKMYL